MAPKNTATKAQDNNNAELLAEIERLRAENAELAAAKAKGGKVGAPKISLKISEKGALSIYGLGRFPVTLYASQWTRLLSVAKDIAQFMVDHKSELKEKAQ